MFGFQDQHIGPGCVLGCCSHFFGSQILIWSSYAAFFYPEIGVLCILVLQTSLKHFSGSIYSFIFHKLQKTSQVLNVLQIQSPRASGFFLNLNLLMFLHSHRACEKGIYELPSGLFTKYLGLILFALFCIFIIGSFWTLL